MTKEAEESVRKRIEEGNVSIRNSKLIITKY